MLTYADNVYLVRGKYNCCFYDLNKNYLYHCSSDYADIADCAIHSAMFDFSLEQKEKLKTIMHAGIIVEADTAINDGDIRNLKLNNRIDFAWIELTKQCNMRCVHCYDNSCAENTTNMSFEEYMQVIDQLGTMGINKIQLIGGEPLLLSELEQMIVYAHKRMDSITVFTNASLITNDLSSFFEKYGIRIAVSVYSYEENEHEKVTRVKGSYQATMRGIGLLKKHNVKYRVATVLMNGINTGVKNTDLFEIKNGDVVRLTGRADGRLLNNELIRNKLITKETFSHGISRSFCARTVHGHNCFSRRLYIAADLTVYPCVMERRMAHGNLKESSLKDIIKPEILQFNKDKVNGCADCEFRYACFDCRPNTISGHIEEKPWYCTYMPKTGQWEKDEEAIARIKSLLK